MHGLLTGRRQLVGAIWLPCTSIHLWREDEGLLHLRLTQLGKLLQADTDDDKHNRHHHTPKQELLVALHYLEPHLQWIHLWRHTPNRYICLLDHLVFRTL